MADYNFDVKEEDFDKEGMENQLRPIFKDVFFFKLIRFFTKKLERELLLFAWENKMPIGCLKLGDRRYFV